MTDKQLSPAAQAVLDAYENTIGYRQGFAAVIRKLADQVVPEDFDYWDGRTDDYAFGCETGQNERNAYIRQALFAIAAELEGK
jgi:hypothetical protein